MLAGAERAAFDFGDHSAPVSVGGNRVHHPADEPRVDKGSMGQGAIPANETVLGEQGQSRRSPRTAGRPIDLPISEDGDVALMRTARDVG